jgi:hypothetical protein
VVEQLAARKDDPPDCEALVDGQRCGIEVTELVHERALRLSAKGGNERHFAWDRDDFAQELADLSFETELITDILFGISYDPSV